MSGNSNINNKPGDSFNTGPVYVTVSSGRRGVWNKKKKLINHLAGRFRARTEAFFDQTAVVSSSNRQQQEQRGEIKGIYGVINFQRVLMFLFFVF